MLSTSSLSAKRLDSRRKVCCPRYLQLQATVQVVYQAIIHSHDWVAGHSINSFGKLSQRSISDVDSVVVVDETTCSNHNRCVEYDNVVMGSTWMFRSTINQCEEHLLIVMFS